MAVKKRAKQVRVSKSKSSSKNSSTGLLFTDHPNLTWLLPIFVIAVLVYIVLLTQTH
jgi:hypothetical protein